MRNPTEAISLARALLTETSHPRVIETLAAAVAAETGLVATSIYAALPAAIALFPQELRIPAERLEPEFRDVVGRDGTPVTHVVCNKGL